MPWHTPKLFLNHSDRTQEAVDMNDATDKICPAQALLGKWRHFAAVAGKLPAHADCKGRERNQRKPQQTPQSSNCHFCSRWQHTLPSHTRPAADVRDQPEQPKPSEHGRHSLSHAKARWIARSVWQSANYHNCRAAEIEKACSFPTLECGKRRNQGSKSEKCQPECEPPFTRDPGVPKAQNRLSTKPKIPRRAPATIASKLTAVLRKLRIELTARASPVAGAFGGL